MSPSSSHLRFVIHLMTVAHISHALQTFRTNTVAEYSGTIISCTDNEDCEITCQHEDGCKNIHINCPANHSCVIKCHATNACQNAVIIATHSSSLTIHDCSNGMSMYIPPHNNGVPRATIKGKQSSHTNESFTINIYAIYGWDDIDIIKPDNSVRYNGTMHCTVGYEEHCAFSRIRNASCPEMDHICNRKLNGQMIDQKGFVESGTINELWFVALILVIAIIAVAFGFTLFLFRSYRFEKQLMVKCGVASHQLTELRKVYTDKSVAKEESSDKRPQTVIHLKLSDIPTPKSVVMFDMNKPSANSRSYYSDSSTVTHTVTNANLKTVMSFVPTKNSNISVNSSMFVACHEMDYENTEFECFQQSKHGDLSILKDENEDEF